MKLGARLACASALAFFCAGCIQRAPRPNPEPYLKTLSTSQNADALSRAAIALGNMREARAALLLVPHLRHKSARVRSQTAMALGQIADPATAEPLRKALVLEQSTVARRWMVWACGQTGGTLEKETLQGLKITEKSKAVYRGENSVDKQVLKELDTAIATIDARLSGKEKR